MQTQTLQGGQEGFEDDHDLHLYCGLLKHPADLLLEECKGHATTQLVVCLDLCSCYPQSQHVADLSQRRES